MKLDVEQLRYLSRDDFRVLTALEQGMKNHDVVPTELVAAISGLRSGASKVLAHLTRQKLISHECGAYEGYRLTYPGYDFLALRTLMLRGVLASVGRQIGVGKESDIYLGETVDGDRVALKFQRLGRTSFRAVARTRDYARGRRAVGWLYLSRLATAKEFAFMQALADADFPVPTPIACNRHLLVMSVVPGRTLSLHRGMPSPATAAAVWDSLMATMLRLAAAGLVHCDYNEFNVLVDFPGAADGNGSDEEGGSARAHTAVLAGVRTVEETDAAIADGATLIQKTKSAAGVINAPAAPFVLTVIDFPQMVSITHPHARELFERDVLSLRLYFSRRFAFTPARIPTFDAALAASESGDANISGLDVACEASGWVRPREGEAPPVLPLLAARIAAALAADNKVPDDARAQLSEALAAAAGNRSTANGGQAASDDDEEGGGEEEESEERAAYTRRLAAGLASSVESGDGMVELGGATDEGGGGVSGAPDAASDAPIGAELAAEEDEEVNTVTLNSAWASRGAPESSGNETGSDGDSGTDLERDKDDDALEAAHEAALLAQRPIVARSRPNGRRVRDSARGGEAYLTRRRDEVSAATEAVARDSGVLTAGDPDRAAIAARTRTELERKAHRREIANAASRAGKGRGEMKDRAKQKAREATRESTGSGGGYWG